MGYFLLLCSVMVSALYSNSYSLKSGTNVASGADFNTYTTPGIYFATSNAIAAGCANCPSGRAGRLIVEWTIGASTVLRQTYIEYVESASTPTANVYVRVSDNGASGWRACQKQPTHAEVDSLNNRLVTWSGVPANGTQTINAKGLQGLLVIIGANADTRGVYLIAGYSGSVEHVAIHAAGSGVFSVSGTTISVKNTNANYSMNIGFIKMFG